MELRSFSHGYGQITYHIVLVPKYRYKIFYDKHVKKDCELILNNICMEQGYRIHAMEIVEDHVHYNGSAEGHGYPDLQVGEEVDPRLDFMFS